MRRREQVRIGMASVVVGLALTLLLTPDVLRVQAGTESTPTPLSVTIDTAHPGMRIPRGFLGLSFELSSLPTIARYASHGDFARMLRSLGPGVLRFGGVSADTGVAWTDAATPRPAWAHYTIDGGELRSLRKLAERSGWQIVLTVGLAHYDPRAAAREAAAAKTALGGWLAGIEVGNEPDAYARHRLRSAPWTFSRYDTQLRAYRRAVEQAAPGLALLGPDVSGSKVFASWGSGLAVRERPALLTGHHYPMSCHATPGPTVARLLSQPIRQAEDASLRRYMAVSSGDSIHFRMDEANTVSCGGVAGISDTFASALWATDYIAHAMLAGVWGINFQGNPLNCRGYTPVCASSAPAGAEGALIAQPEWYALLLSKALVGDRPVRTIAASTRANVDVIALLGARGELHVVIVDDEPVGARHATVSLHTGSRLGSATALSLTAPSLAATRGVRLAGRAVGRDGEWPGPAQLQHLPNRAGVIALDVSPASAVLVTIA